MATAPILDAPTALVPAGNNAAAAVVLFDQNKFDDFYARLKAEVDAVPVDLSTKKGRDAIASVAAKVRTEKASIDKDRLRLTKEWRDNTALVNGAWNGIKDRLDALAVEARRPLTEWEEAEADRIQTARSRIDWLKAAATVSLDDSVASVRERGREVWQATLDPELFRDLLSEAEAVKAATVDVLKAALARLTREEDERAELERLRAAEAERVAKEQAEREVRDAEERAAAEAKAEEERRAAAEKAEQDRIAAAQQEAEDRAKREAEAAAEADRQRIQRDHEEALAAERRRAEQAEADAQAERDRAAKEEADRKAEADRAAAEQARRESDQAHRTARKTAAKEAIIAIGIPEAKALKLVQAIVAGDIPNVRLEF